MKKNIIVMAMLAVATLPAVAANASNEVYAGAGTTGLTVGYARAMSASSGIRLEVNVLSYNGELDDADIHYDAKLKMNTVGAYYDYFPLQGSSFRLTGGALFGNRKVDLSARGNLGMVTLNGKEYNASGESLFASVKLPNASPYLGIGFGHKANRAGPSFTADFGIAYGKPDVSLSATPALIALAGQANVDAERNKVQEKVDKYNIYPVIRLGIAYAF